MQNIVIVDDDKNFATCLKETLEDEDGFYVLQTLSSERDALDFFNSKKLTEVDCILLDLKLCAESGDSKTSSDIGISLLRHLRNQVQFYGNVIVLTNSTAVEDGQKALLAGCDSYLCKSVASTDMEDLIQELIVAIRHRVLLVSDRMRHVFFRAEISPKEAQLLDLLYRGKTWPQVAQLLGYNSAKAAANTADRIYDKIIPIAEHQNYFQTGAESKRERALEIWCKRNHLTPERFYERLERNSKRISSHRTGT